MRKAWLVAIPAVLWWGCPKSEVPDAGEIDAGPAQLTEVEPNDRSDQAQPLSGSAVVTGQLSADPARADEDWYELSSTGPVTLDVVVGEMKTGDVVLEVLDEDRNRLVMVNSEGEAKAERIPNLGLNRRAFLRVYGAKKGVGGAYTLTVLYGPRQVGFEVEPNDRAVDGNALPLGEPVSGFIGHPGDEDWYRFELAPADPPILPVPEAPAPVEIDAGLEQQPAAELGAEDAGTPAEEEESKVALRIDLSPVEGVRFDLSVLSEAEAPLFQVKSKDGEGLSLRNVGVRSSDRVVYVVVKSAWTGTGKEARRGYQPDRSYTLSVAEEEAGANAEFEPNDELLKATPLPLNGYREGFLAPKTDVDYYVLKPDQPVLAKVQLSGVERLDLALSVVAPGDAPGGAEKVLVRVSDGEVKEPEYLNNLACAETCYLKVESALKKVDGKWVKDFENPEVPYRLSVTTTPDDGSEEREPNNTLDGASGLDFGKPVRGTIHPKKDVDYYRVDLSGRMVKTPLRATVTGILKVDLGLYLHRVEEDGKLSLVQTADRAKGDAPESITYSADPGVYVLEVRDSKNREANFQDAYQLSIEESD